MEHTDHNKIHLPIIPCPSCGSHTFQIACVSVLLEGPSIPTNPNCFTSILDLTLELGFAIAYLSPDRSTPRGPRNLSDPFVKDRHTFHQAFTDSCTAPRSSQKAFFHFFATLFRQHSSGISLVYPKFSTRHILLQMYPPDIQHTSTDNSEQKGALVFKDLVRQTLISVAHLFGSFARVPLEGQGRTSQGRTFSCL